MARKQVEFEYRDRVYEIGLTIAALRKLKGYSQADLAAKSNLSRQTIALIESPNACPAFTIETLLKIADALEVSPADILSNTFPSSRKP